MSLQPLLRQPYARDTYRTILEDVLPSGTLQLLQSPQTIIAACEFVTATAQIGTIELPDGSTIALLEVHVGDQIKLARNRVALRNFVARFIDEARTTAVLAVFHQPGKPDWRLTYACKRSQLDDDTMEITSTQTAPRRYTFLLGENEPCRTAAGRLAELREKGEHLTLEEVEKAFSVERLNKDFFKDYKKHYETFVAHLLASENAKATRTAFGITKHSDKDEQDKADKPIRDFVKRLLGRLVFLHFLQKKGWMGCPELVVRPSGRSGTPAKAGTTNSWTGGDPDFLASYFAHAESKNDAHRFHSRWLIPLFFEALNNAERPGDLFPPTGTRIPYLNGGLFETDPAPLHALDFPAEHFRALLEFFGQYHFTIDENDPEDHEVGIDPEMLGHIFENLLEDNKDKGAYYTPKAIVSYMARQSLLHYLQTHLGENAELAVLLNEKDTARHTDKDSFVRQNAKRIADLLDTVKICDPAIGSGAFPIGVLQEILWTRLTLNWELNTPEERAKLKRRIIQNSIHGVDLDPGAVEIARLRFWLALVVDEDQPRPLPNLDYKIHRADSLIEYIRGEPVHLGKVSAEDKRTHGAIQSLIAAKAALFTAQKLPDKRAARFALYRALAEVAMAEFTWLRNEMGLIANDAERAAQLDHGLKEFGHRMKLIDSAAKESTKIQDRILTDLRAWFDDDKNPTFLWQLHFGEVFAQGGFDIVIGNPPYISVEKFARTNVQSNWRERFVSYAARGDVYCFFYERALEMLRPNGALSFISSNKFQRAAYGQSLRHLLSQHRLHTLIDFCELPVFAAATDPIIVVVSRTSPHKSHHVEVLVVKDAAEISGLLYAIGSRAQKLPFNRLTKDGWSLEGNSAASLGNKIVSVGTTLSSVVAGQFHYGIKTGFNDAFVIDAATRKQIISEQPSAAKLIKPWFGGKDIERWYHTNRDLYCIVFPFGFHEQLKQFPPVLKHLTSFRAKLSARGQCQTSRSGDESGQHHWLELDNNPSAEYLSCFESRHILLPIIKKGHGFCITSAGNYSNDKTTICIADEPEFVLACLNSRVIEWLCRMTFPGLGDPWAGGRLEYRVGLVKKLPIPPASAADKARLSQLAEACAAAAQRGDDDTLAVHEAEIDQIVYRLFDLTPEEIALIESALAPTRESKPARVRKAKPSSPLTLRVEPVGDEVPTVSVKTSTKSEAAWLPGELFSVEGELPAAKKARAAPEAASKADKSVRAPVQAASEDAIPIDQTERDDVLAVVRETFSSGGARDRETALREVSQALGYERLGTRIREILNRDIRTAVRRGILQNNGEDLSILCRSIEHYERAFLKEQFLAAINQSGRVWVERDDAIRIFARWLGFRRTGSLIDTTARSLINGLLRDGSLEKDGQDCIRRL